MTTVFLVCAAVGGTILVLQFVLSLIGLGGEALDIDLPGDVDADFDVDADLDFDADVGTHADPSWLFGVISFRTVVAALTFFGLAGLGAQSVEAGTFQTLAVAVLAGLAAMYGVYYLMRCISKLKAEGTARIQRAIGRHGTVYTTIPADESGTGKIQLNLQNRTMEYLALTSGHALAPGAKVVVTDVITSNTVAVEPVLESERNNHA
ncbi:MAG: hypothetical protein A2V70_04605 [Planctomycetes bacterium RBG_13_63_9]|nr:MAG: hypothetical protein A2V70_04605 [Planctomycetes bacterium RBG_13_63_9]